jgi:hypothetical protein
MTDATLPRNAVHRPVLDRLVADEPVMARLGMLLVLSLAVTLAAAQIDPRPLDGENIWLKPVKFQLSLATYALTLAFFARYLPPGLTARRGWRVWSGIVAACILAELAWIGGAAAMGTTSHFNVSSPVWAALYSLMGVFAVTLTAMSLVMGIIIARNPATGLPPAVHRAVWLGLVLTFALTVPVAGYMAGGPGHHVGTPVTGATLWPLGWSREVGDLRVPHFFAAHALQFIPVGGWVAARLLPPRAAMSAVLVGAFAFALLVAATFAQALAGQPLI